MDTGPGNEYKRRRIALGLDVLPFAREMGKNRDQVNSVERGGARASTVKAYVETLERLEREHDKRAHLIEPPSGEDTVEIVASKDFQEASLRIVARGSIDDADRLRKVVGDLLRQVADEESSD